MRTTTTSAAGVGSGCSTREAARRPVMATTLIAGDVTVPGVESARMERRRRMERG
jgi:hypothetical protein